MKSVVWAKNNTAKINKMALDGSGKMDSLEKRRSRRAPPSSSLLAIYLYLRSTCCVSHIIDELPKIYVYVHKVK